GRSFAQGHRSGSDRRSGPFHIFPIHALQNLRSEQSGPVPSSQVSSGQTHLPSSVFSIPSSYPLCLIRIPPGNPVLNYFPPGFSDSVTCYVSWLDLVLTQSFS